MNTNLKVLVVDDEKPVRDMVGEMVESFGLQVVTTDTSDDAINICGNDSIDILITDIVMPERNGLDLIMEFKKKFPAIPIIAVSGGGGITGQYDYLQIAKLIGAKNILRKPFSLQEIKSALDDVLDNHFPES
jgi:DNA-binding NtrC family response regulator